MRVYLLNPPFIKGFSRGVRGGGEVTRGGTLFYPIFLAYATGALEGKSHDVRLIDAQAKDWTLEDVKRDIIAFNPRIIVVDTNFSSLNSDIETAVYLKNVSNALLILVGPPMSQYSREILINYNVDFVIRYEYDLSLSELVDAIEGKLVLNKIKGISYKENDKIVENPDRELLSSDELNNLPFVSEVYKKHLDVEDYFVSSSFHPMVQLFTGRGCPNKCTFCSWPKTFMGNRYRARSVENVLDEFEYIEEELPRVKEIFIEDDTFTIDRKRVLKFCEEYRKRELDLVWSCNARVSLNYETMMEMKKSNCRLVVVGYESGSDAILKNIKKNISIKQIRKFSEDAKRANLLVHGDFIIGLPGETKESIRETEKLIYEIKPDIIQVLLPQPIPGTYLYEWARFNGFLHTDDPNDYLDERGYQKAVVSYPWLSREEMLSECNRILKGYYLSPRYIPLAVGQVLRKNNIFEFKRLFYCALMFLKYAK